MNQTVTTLTPGGRALGQSLGFDAAAVIVDNYTSSYVRLPDVGKTIPPWVYGAVVALPPGIRQANASLLATVPAVPGPPVPVSQATLTWTDAALASDPGHLLQQASFAQAQIITKVQVPATSGTTTGSFSIPAGTVGLGLQADANIGAFGLGPASLFVFGDQSGQILVAGETPWGTSAAGPASQQYNAITPVDTTATWQADQSLFGEDSAVWIIAYLSPPFPPRPSTPLDFFKLGQFQMGVSQELAVPAVWQTPRQPVHASRVGVGTTNLIAAVAGQSCWVFGGVLDVQVAAAGSTVTLQDTGGKVFLRVSGATVRTIPFPFSGTPSDADKGLDLVVAGGAATAEISFGATQSTTPDFTYP